MRCGAHSSSAPGASPRRATHPSPAQAPRAPETLAAAALRDSIEDHLLDGVGFGEAHGFWLALSGSASFFPRHGYPRKTVNEISPPFAINIFDEGYKTGKVIKKTVCRIKRLREMQFQPNRTLSLHEDGGQCDDMFPCLFEALRHQPADPIQLFLILVRQLAFSCRSL